MRLAFGLLILPVLYAGEARCVSPSGTLCHTMRMASTTWSFFRDGWRDVSRESNGWLFALRADGSNVYVRSEVERVQLTGMNMPAMPAPPRIIYLAEQRRWFRIDDVTRVTRSYRTEDPARMPEDPICEKAATPERSRYGLELAGMGWRKGVRVAWWSARTQVGQIRRELQVEYAPDLACACVYRKETERVSGWLPYLVKLDEAVELKLGEPDPALFEIPGDYAKRGDPAR